MRNPTFNWNEQKNKTIKETRNISFEEVVSAISEGNILDIIVNRRGQKCFVVKINNYVHVAPYVENKEEIFLKTVYPSRKYQKSLLQGKKI